MALLRHGARPAELARDLLSGASGEALLDSELGLLAHEARERATREIDAWRRRGIEVLTSADPGYPPCLRTAAEPPALLFVSGNIEVLHRPAVAVIGSRQASRRGLRAAQAISQRLVGAGFNVVSGLAAGADTAAHEATLACGGDTVAVIGTGLDRCYPTANLGLQRRIADAGAVVSQFWPEAGPTRRSFPMRNGVMAGLTMATVIVEASERSGTRIQARMSLASGRKVLLLAALLEHDWARELADHPGVEVVTSSRDLDAALRSAGAEKAAA